MTSHSAALLMEVPSGVRIHVFFCHSRTDLAQVVLDFHGKGSLEFIRFPDELSGRYQTFTQADLTQLRTAGYQDPCLDLNAGVRKYLAWLNH